LPLLAGRDVSLFDKGDCVGPLDEQHQIEVAGLGQEAFEVDPATCRQADVRDQFPALQDRFRLVEKLRSKASRSVFPGPLQRPREYGPGRFPGEIKFTIIHSFEEGQWRIKDVPLGEGMVDFDKYFGLYKSLHIKAPVSIHYEYNLGGAEHGDRNPTMGLDEISQWLKKDITFLKQQFKKFGL